MAFLNNTYTENRSSLFAIFTKISATIKYKKRRNSLNLGPPCHTCSRNQTPTKELKHLDEVTKPSGIWVQKHYIHEEESLTPTKKQIILGLWVIILPREYYWQHMPFALPPKHQDIVEANITDSKHFVFSKSSQNTFFESGEWRIHCSCGSRMCLNFKKEYH